MLVELASAQLSDYRGPVQAVGPMRIRIGGVDPPRYRAGRPHAGYTSA